MSEIEFGWAMPSGARDKALRDSFPANVRRGLDLVSGHFKSAWLIDHLQFDEIDVLEGWTTVAYLSALYPELKFGHGVLCQSYRNPALLAKMAATLQYMSGDRFILGLGAGWKQDEYEAYGYDFPPPGVRVRQLDETLQIIKALYTQERATFRGEHYSVKEAWFEPKPAHLPPIMVGGSRPRMLRLIARHADWWNVSWTPIADYRQEVEECERACAEVGRDPLTLRRTWFGGCACGPTHEKAVELTGGRFSAGRAFVGTPDEIVEQMRPFIELGVDYFMLGSGGFPDLTTLELLVNEVLPQVNRMAREREPDTEAAAK